MKTVHDIKVCILTKSFATIKKSIDDWSEIPHEINYIIIIIIGTYYLYTVKTKLQYTYFVSCVL